MLINYTYPDIKRFIVTLGEEVGEEEGEEEEETKVISRMQGEINKYLN